MREKVRPITILNPINIWGRLAIHIIRFGGWLFEVTGNNWEKALTSITKTTK